MIWFIVAVIVATSTSVIFIGVVDTYAEGFEDVGEHNAGSIKTAVAFVNDPAMVPYETSTGNISFYIKNTREYVIDIDTMVLVVNGTHLAGRTLNVTLLGTGPNLQPGEVANIYGTIPNLQPNRDYPAWITVNGLSPSGHIKGDAMAKMNFRIKET